MRYGKREPRQGVLAFEPPLRVRLPEAVRQEAVTALASLMAAMLGEADRSEPDGGSDE